MPPGVEIVSPVAAPFPWSAWARPINRSLVARRTAARALTLRDPLTIWTFLPTPTAIDTVRASLRPTSVLIYYCVSDFSTIGNDPRRLRAAEDELLSLADLVFVNGQTLRSHFQQRHPRVRVYPFGANTEQFDPGQEPSEPSDVASIPRPRLGYVGGLHRHLAIDWLRKAATALPDVSIVLVGPQQPDVDLTALRKLPNVHLIGPRPHRDLSGYIAAFDVCLIPYAPSAYMDSVVPTKLFEYLAMDRPVVSSDLLELRSLLTSPSPVTLAGSADAFLTAVRERLAKPVPPESFAAGRALAQRYSWGALLRRMIEDIEEVRRVKSDRARR